MLKDKGSKEYLRSNITSVSHKTGVTGTRFNFSTETTKNLYKMYETMVFRYWMSGNTESDH